MKSAFFALALGSILTSQTGCAVLLTGYLIGDSIARDKATATCRSNLTTTNNERIAKGLDAFPDQCGR